MTRNKLKKKLVELLKSFDDSEADSYEDNADLIMDVLESTISQTRQEVIEEIKKALPSHPNGMISRNEVKKILDRL